MSLDVIYNEDCLTGIAQLPESCVQCCVTSPPYYGLRDYGVEGQIGLEESPEEYVSRLVAVFHEVRRVLKADGTLWLNLGDSYTGSANSGGANRNAGGPAVRNADLRSKRGTGLKPKDLIGIPWRVAFALQADGWYLRQDIIWHKPNPMPESVRDRCTKAHEYLFLLSKSPRYFFDAEAIKTEGSMQQSGNTQHKYINGQQLHRTKSGFLKMRQQQYPKVNRRSVWTVTPTPYSGAHFATMPEALVEPCVLAGSKPGDAILDPFMGAGTTAKVAMRHQRRYVGYELNASYCHLAQQRLANSQPRLIAS